MTEAARGRRLPNELTEGLHDVPLFIVDASVSSLRFVRPGPTSLGPQNTSAAIHADLNALRRTAPICCQAKPIRHSIHPERGIRINPGPDQDRP